MIWAAFKSVFNLSDYRIEKIDSDQISPELMGKLKQFEASFTYPFSDRERFRIEHGKNGDYFAFFKGLGKVHYYVATSKETGEIAAVGCGILRSLPTQSGQPIQAWYICDLKVGEKFRGEKLPLMMFSKAAWRYLQAPRGYGICMNPPEGPPKAAEIWRKHSPMKGLNTQILNLYTLNAEQAVGRRPEIEKVLRDLGILKEQERLSLASTNGVKDYQIFGADPNQTHPWQLLHFQRSASGEFAPQVGHAHMLSAVEGSPLDIALKRLLGPHSSTAEIVSFGMEKVDFNYLTSNEI